MDSSSASSHASATNAAVQRCIQAGRKAYENARAQNQKEYDSGEAANKAFIAALPHLSGADNIRDFIACVAYAMTKGIIFMPTATKLLYAAQVAIGAVEHPAVERRESPRKKAPASEPSGQPESADSVVELQASAAA